MMDVEDAVLQPLMRTEGKNAPREIIFSEVPCPKTPTSIPAAKTPLAKKGRNGVTA
jgi:hypothetical protein